MNKVYLLMHGNYGTEGCLEEIFELKKDAENYIKSQESHFIKRRIYECDDVCEWYRIDCHSIIKKCV